MTKLKILISGVVLLMLTASIFGIVDYVKASEKGVFKTLYKDEVTTVKNKLKDIELDDYSRGIIESEPVATQKTEKKKKSTITKKAIKKEILETPVVLNKKKLIKKEIKPKEKISFKSFSRARLDRIPTPPKEIVIIDSAIMKNNN
jgi:hypothetical protein